MIGYRPIKASRPDNRRRTIIGLGLIVVLLFGLSQTNFRHTPGNISFQILRPFWSLATGTSQPWTEFTSALKSKSNLTEENAHLREIINQQSIDLLKQDILTQENATLRQIVNRADDPRPLSVGRLLNQGLQFPFGTTLIDTGRLEVSTPLTTGVVVAAEGSVALGELIEVYATGAKMIFYSTSGNRLRASLGEDHVPIDLSGRGGGNFLASLPRDLPIEVGDQVTIAVAGHEFLLAVVSDITRTAGGSFQEVFLRVPINISQLAWVEMYEP